LQVDLCKVADSGWRKYGPGMLYTYITSFLLRMQRLVNESADLDLEAISGDGAHTPYSLNEFHDLLAEEYGSVLTNGDSTQKAVVYHTTPSKRIRHVGWYHVFDYNSHPIASIPDPLQQNVPEVAQRPTDCFWSVICSTFVDGLQISIGHVLVGKLLLTHFPNVLQTGTITQNEMLQLHKKDISNFHTLEYLFPDYKWLQTFVKNCLVRTLKWKFLLTPSHPEREVILQKKEICSNFQMECIDEGLDPELQQTIQDAINERKLESLISTGSRGMNSDYILFLHGLRISYHEMCAVLCSRGMKGRAATSEIKKRWFSEDYILPDNI